MRFHSIQQYLIFIVVSLLAHLSTMIGRLELLAYIMVK